MLKKILMVSLIILAAAAGILFLRKSPPTTLQTSTPVGNPPFSYEVKNVPYNYGQTDCCYCAAIMAMMKYVGIPEAKVQDYWQDLKDKNYYQDNAIFFRLLKKYGLEGKLNMVYFPHGTKEITFKDIYSANLKDYSKQVQLLKTQEGALPILKNLVADNIPVGVWVEDNPQIMADEVQDDTFVLVYGYNESGILFWTLPGVKSSWSTNEFVSRWRLQENNFPFPVIPGRYNLVWLEK